MSDNTADSSTEMEIVPTSEEVPVEAKKRIHEDEDESCSPDDAKRQKTEGGILFRSIFYLYTFIF
jgi:hypothetical protein